MTMLEKIARAIWVVQRRDLDKCDMELEDVGNHYETFDMAHSVLEAMLDATPTMYYAGNCCPGIMDSKWVWQAMIRAALDEENGQ